MRNDVVGSITIKAGSALRFVTALQLAPGLAALWRSCRRDPEAARIQLLACSPASSFFHHGLFLFLTSPQ